MGFELVSPMGPLFLSLSSPIAKLGPLPQASHLLPAPLFGGNNFALLLKQRFPLFASFSCAAAWLGEEGSHSTCCLIWEHGFSGSFWPRLLPESRACLKAHAGICPSLLPFPRERCHVTLLAITFSWLLIVSIIRIETPEVFQDL